MGDNDEKTEATTEEKKPDPVPEPPKAPAPVVAEPYVELRSVDGGHRVHNVLRVDWEALDRPQSIEDLQQAMRNGGGEKIAAAAAARSPSE